MFWACAAPVSAVLINVDFQGAGPVANGVPGAVLQPDGGVWNVNGPGWNVEVPLVSHSGDATPVRLWTSGFTGTLQNGDAVTSDYLAGSLQLRGLDPNRSYELVLYTAAGILTIFDILGEWNPTAASANRPPFCPYDPNGGIGGGVEGCSYVRGEAFADALGVITIDAGWGAIAGLQVAPNPEPSVALLQAVAVLLGLSRRKRPCRAAG